MTRPEYKTHSNTLALSAEGTHLQGYVVATYKELLNAFGEPMGGDGYKTDAEWIIQFNDGTLATIYNWKNGHNYCGEDECFDLKYITEWNIGGKSKVAEALVKQALGQLA